MSEQTPARDASRECPPGVHSIFDPCPGDCGEPLPDEAYPPDTDFSIEIFDVDMWMPVSFKQVTIEKAREVRDRLRAKQPKVKTRIVQWHETSTVVETDEIEEGETT
jgi:hypothetical protein